jgi:hypothetical protein
MSPSQARGVGGNVSQRDTVHLILRGPSSATTGRRPDGCHRTTKANIRSRLYGGPQGRNPHFLRTSVYHVRGYKPIEVDRSRAEIESNDLQSQCVFRITSEHPDTLKGVGSARIEERSGRTGPPGPLPGDDHITSECPVTLKGIGLGPPPGVDSPATCVLQSEHPDTLKGVGSGSPPARAGHGYGATPSHRVDLGDLHIPSDGGYT